MKRLFLLMTTAMLLTLTASAQADKVHQFFRVSDPTFNVNFGRSSNPLRNPDGTFVKNENGEVMRGETLDNESNPLNNSFTITAEWGTAAWEFGGPFWEHGTDWSMYDKLVIRISSCLGNNLTFSIWDYESMNTGNSPDDQFQSPDDIVEFDEEQILEFDLKEGLDRRNGNGQLNLKDIKQLRFWNYWDIHGEKINPDEANYDPDFVDEYPGAAVTVTIAAMYLERTLANGEKDYLDLLADNKVSFTDDFLAEDGEQPSYIDNTGILHMNENAEAGIFFDEQPADWSAYKYLVIVPQTPNGDGIPTIKYIMTDANDNLFESGQFRYGFWNRPRAAVQDLSAVLTTFQGDDQESFLDAFDTKKIASLKWSLWGGVSTWEYGIAGVWLSNTAPTYSPNGFGEGTDQTGDYIIENAAENTVRTICLPFAAALCGAQVYEIAGIDNPADPAELYAKPYYGILKAGKPYIIRTNSARNVTAFRAGANEVSEPEANGALVADEFTTYYVEADKNLLVLNADGDTFEAVVEDDIRVNSNTAYVDCSKLPKAEEQENGLVFAVKDAKPFTPAETAINEIVNGKSVNGKSVNGKSVNGKFCYDLSGRKVTTPTKGIYVKNGKKYIVK